MKKFNLPSTFAAIFALAMLSTYALAMGGFNIHVNVASGEKKKVSYAYSSQVQGNPIPYSLKPLTSPKHGTISIERGSYDTKVFYQSRKGFVGEDSFQYVRVSDDRFAGTYTVAVTVR